MILEPGSQDSIQHDKGFRFSSASHVASRQVGKPYKTCRNAEFGCAIFYKLNYPGSSKVDFAGGRARARYRTFFNRVKIYKSLKG